MERKNRSLPLERSERGRVGVGVELGALRDQRSIAKKGRHLLASLPSSASDGVQTPLEEAKREQARALPIHSNPK
ncbi:MAG: hypothetical protein AMXMBFR61_13640 [Fimbriimonadales bacterium]